MIIPTNCTGTPTSFHTTSHNKHTTSTVTSYADLIPEIWDGIYRLFYFGVVGNALVIIYFWQNKSKARSHLNAYHFLIVELAAVDLLICLFLAVKNWDISYLHPIPDYLIWTYIDTLTSLSCWFLVLLSFERYWSIVHPFKQKNTVKTFFFISLAMTVFFALAYFIHFYFVEEIIVYFERLIMHGFIEVILPIICMYYFNLKIGRRIQTENLNDGSVYSHAVYRKKKKRALNTLKTLNIVYAASIIPGRTINFSFFFVENFFKKAKQYHTMFNHVYNASNVLFYVNNMVNVIVYAKIIVDFRRYVIAILKCNCLKKIDG